MVSKESNASKHHRLRTFTRSHHHTRTRHILKTFTQNHKYIRLLKSTAICRNEIRQTVTDKTVYASVTFNWLVTLVTYLPSTASSAPCAWSQRTPQTTIRVKHVAHRRNSRPWGMTAGVLAHKAPTTIHSTVAICRLRMYGTRAFIYTRTRNAAPPAVLA